MLVSKPGQGSLEKCHESKSLNLSSSALLIMQLKTRKLKTSNMKINKYMYSFKVNTHTYILVVIPLLVPTDSCTHEITCRLFMTVLVVLFKTFEKYNCSSGGDCLIINKLWCFQYM